MANLMASRLAADSGASLTPSTDSGPTTAGGYLYPVPLSTGRVTSQGPEQVSANAPGRVTFHGPEQVSANATGRVTSHGPEQVSTETTATVRTLGTAKRLTDEPYHRQQLDVAVHNAAGNLMPIQPVQFCLARTFLR